MNSDLPFYTSKTSKGLHVFGELVSDKIEAVLEWAGDNPNFNDGFIKSVRRQFDNYGWVSIKQWDSLNNIIRAFKIDLQSYGYFETSEETEGIR